MQDQLGNKSQNTWQDILIDAMVSLIHWSKIYNAPMAGIK